VKRASESGRAALVSMVKTADLQEGHHMSFRRCLNASRCGRILFEGEMCSGSMIVAKIRAKEPPEMSATDDNHVIQTLAAD
jgi:hypothetical protein